MRRGVSGRSCWPPDPKPQQVRFDTAERHDGAVVGRPAGDGVAGNETLKHFPLLPEHLIERALPNDQTPIAPEDLNASNDE